LAQEGAGAVYWYENTWHYYEQWEHLLEGKSLSRTGYPFQDQGGAPRCRRYAREDLPKTAELVSRTLSFAVNVYMDDQIPKIVKAIEKAGPVLS
jgi:8-amino-3,8-dideoxy-alpha-D-manno-octulosonate transaminase